MYLRSEAGAVSQRMVSVSPEWNGRCSIGRDGIFPTVEGYDDISMIHSGLLSNRGNTVINGSWHVADGVALRRAQGILK